MLQLPTLLVLTDAVATVHVGLVMSAHATKDGRAAIARTDNAQKALHGPL